MKPTKLHFIPFGCEARADRITVEATSFAEAERIARCPMIGIQVGTARAIIGAGERRDRERAARHAGEAGIALPMIREVDAPEDSPCIHSSIV